MRFLSPLSHNTEHFFFLLWTPIPWLMRSHKLYGHLLSRVGSSSSSCPLNMSSSPLTLQTLLLRAPLFLGCQLSWISEGFFESLSLALAIFQILLKSSSLLTPLWWPSLFLKLPMQIPSDQSVTWPYKHPRDASQITGLTISFLSLKLLPYRIKLSLLTWHKRHPGWHPCHPCFQQHQTACSSLYTLTHPSECPWLSFRAVRQLAMVVFVEI